MPEPRRIFSLSLVPIGLTVCVLLIACGGDEDEVLDFTEIDNADGWVFTSNRPEAPVYVVYKTGETFTLLSNDGGATTSGAVFTTPDGSSLLTKAGSDGLPTEAFGDAYTFLFENWAETTVDVGVIRPDGTSEVVRGAARHDYLRAAPALAALGATENQVIAAQLGFSAASCALSGALAHISPHIEITAAAVACEGFLTKGAVYIAQEHAPEATSAHVLEVANVALTAAGYDVRGQLLEDVAIVAVDVALGEIVKYEQRKSEHAVAVDDLQQWLIGGAFGSDGIVFLQVGPGGDITIAGTSFDVREFCIAKHETTNAQYDAFVQSGDGFDSPAWWDDMPPEYLPPQSGLRAQWNSRLDAPRDTVNWYQAVAFTRWLTVRMAWRRADISEGGLLVNGVEWEVRLPTEWEWQWAAQGGIEARDYPWGDWQEGHAEYFDEAGISNYELTTAAVGSYPLGVAKSGALDMSGNVWEWCLNQGRPPYSTSVHATSERRVLRGGSFVNDRSSVTSSIRLNNDPLLGLRVIGFRVGLFPPE